MARKKDTSRVNPFTKRQESTLRQLGAAWGVLDTEENHIFKLIREQYDALGPGANRPVELIDLGHRQREISARKRQISAKVLALEENISRSKRRGGAMRGSSVVLVRDLFIRELGEQSHIEICQELDDLVLRDGSPLGFPVIWADKYGVNSYVEAYKHPKCIHSVRVMISKARKAY
jgi:hypothetical protein